MPPQPVTILPHHIKKKKKKKNQIKISNLEVFVLRRSTPIVHLTHIGLITKRCGNYKMVWMGLRLEIGGAKMPIG